MRNVQEVDGVCATKQKIMITVESDFQGDEVEVKVEFDPPVKNDDHPACAAESIVVRMLEAIKPQAVETTESSPEPKVPRIQCGTRRKKL